MKKLLLSLLLISSITLYSQEEEKVKKVNHYASVQINELLKQILNLSTQPTLSSPFLLNYSLNSAGSGYGFNVGFGYTLNETKTGDDLNSTESKDNTTAFRIGPERKVSLGKKWVLGYGIDFISSSSKNSTVSINKNNFGDENRFETEEKISSTGVGIRGALLFAISSRVLLGTEATYSYMTNKESFKSKNSSNGFVQENESNPETKNISFQAPVVLWLTIKF